MRDNLGGNELDPAESVRRRCKKLWTGGGVHLEPPPQKQVQKRYYTSTFKESPISRGNNLTKQSPLLISVLIWFSPLFLSEMAGLLDK